MQFLNDIWNGFCSVVQYLWDNADLLAFVILAGIAIAAAIYVVSVKEVIHSAFYLALVFVCVAVTYFFLEAEFIGVIQMLVYVGAITILFAFSIMLTRRYIQKSGDDSL
ncbi:MAG: NADH-quinone oxidoreductase subunit J [Candidatus Methanomethylophilaceae archaeon]|nr:NADH-quinone oxidoreductase subunit J [Candidatus Methanomethylophilaceae archaeon]MDD3378385.1 NADH-quinone oxidoreductase subunit J [Candidatus Methanomethylophilaceae archaeon]MDY0224261.1 NADH-quinone oxidoreductase subunit J [Candidatus Methanomethylophilaceae archaeon]